MTDFPGDLPKGGFPFGRDATPCKCDLCGAPFPSKAARRRHKASGCVGTGARIATTGSETVVDDAGKFGRPWEHITPEIKARADAEWEAMDNRGRLPAGWRFVP